MDGMGMSIFRANHLLNAIPLTLGRHDNQMNFMRLAAKKTILSNKRPCRQRLIFVSP